MSWEWGIALIVATLALGPFLVIGALFACCIWFVEWLGKRI